MLTITRKILEIVDINVESQFILPKSSLTRKLQKRQMISREPKGKAGTSKDARNLLLFEIKKTIKLLDKNQRRAKSSKSSI